MVKKYDCIVIGAGAAGLFSSISINKGEILILEKNSSPGKKLLISGAGQCNFTNNCGIDEFLKSYGDKGKFIKPALYNFTNKDCIKFFSSLGVESYIREDNKVFPKSNKSSDILNALVYKCREKKVEIKYKSVINDLDYDKDNELFRIKTPDILYISKILIIATGGKSYPQTGSTGDGYLYAKKLGHSIVDLSPALTPVYVEDYKFNELSGVSLKNISLSLWRNNKKINHFIGDLLFTHKNISGPAIINNSRYMEVGDTLRLNFTDFSNTEEFKNSFEEKLTRFGKLNVKTILKDLNTPKRLINTILKLSNLDQNTICSQLRKDSRKILIEYLSNFPLKVKALGDYNIAMVTKGGVSTKEINAKTMESKIIKNLYFVGEVVDIDGDTGGFNIQAAFSMGKLAGDNINSKLFPL